MSTVEDTAMHLNALRSYTAFSDDAADRASDYFETMAAELIAVRSELTATKTRMWELGHENESLRLRCELETP